MKLHTLRKPVLVCLAFFVLWVLIKAIFLIFRPTVIARARQQCLIVSEAIEAFYRDCKRFPSLEEGFSVLLTNSDIPNWRGPYLIVGRGTTPFHDLWAHELRYRIEGARIHVISGGPDGEFYTHDDIEVIRDIRERKQPESWGIEGVTH